MIFLIDMGNTTLSIALWQGNAPLFSTRIATNRSWQSAEYTAAFAQILQDWGTPNLEGCALSSVVPALTEAVTTALFAATGLQPFVVSYAAKRSFNVLTQDEIGADLLIGAEGAKTFYSAPAIVTDLGSCTKFYALNAAGDVLGVSIAPGIELGLEAMVGRANHLRTVAMQAPTVALGTTTPQSIQSGVLLGAAALVEGMVQRIAAEMPTENRTPQLILTGGLAPVVAPLVRLPLVLAPNLLFQGLHQFYQNNR